MFDYDVFLSFSAQDVAIVKPLWQRLSLGGLRVFWSDETLKQAAGRSFVSVIQEALEASKNFVLVWTPNAASSPWVEEEYQAFYSHCYMRNKTTRRLIVLSTDDAMLSRLPPFLRHLQSVRNADDLVRVLDVVDLDRLRARNAELEAQVMRLTARNIELEARSRDSETLLARARRSASELRTPALHKEPGESENNAGGEIHLQGIGPVPFDYLASVRRVAVDVAQIDLRYSRSLKDYFGAPFQHRNRMPKVNLRGLMRIDLIPYGAVEKAVIKKIGTGCVDTDSCTTRKVSLAFVHGLALEDIFVDIGEAPRYAVGSEGQLYDLADYDILRVDLKG